MVRSEGLPHSPSQDQAVKHMDHNERTFAASRICSIGDFSGASCCLAEILASFRPEMSPERLILGPGRQTNVKPIIGSDF